MSRRPSTMLRQQRANGTRSTVNGNSSGSCCNQCANHSTENPFAIFQDNAASVLYARRLLSNRGSPGINILNEGVDRTKTPNVTDIDFVVNHARCILQFLLGQQHRFIPYDASDEDLEDVFMQFERVVQYYIGGGPLGDFISAYYIPRVGPWFFDLSTINSNKLQKFFSEYTTRTRLNSQEQIISDRISNIWNIPFTGNVVVDVPSILDSHYIFLKQNGNEYIRELFLDEYNMVKQSPNSNILSDLSYITFTPQGTGSTNNPLYDVNAAGTIIRSLQLAWRSGPYKYLETASEGGLTPQKFLVPITYRAVIPIPIGGTGASKLTSNTNYDGFPGFYGFGGCTAGVNLTNATGPGDLLTTHIAFSLPEVNNNKCPSNGNSNYSNNNSKSFGWLMSAYTTKEDLSVVDPGGKYADEDKILLIVEGLSIGNRRPLRYSTAQNQIQILFNHPTVETNYLRQFALIVSSIYYAYTGVPISPNALLPEMSICSCSGLCSDSSIISDYATRESPMGTVLGLVSLLFGQNILPSPDSVSCSC